MAAEMRPCFRGAHAAATLVPRKAYLRFGLPEDRGQRGTGVAAGSNAKRWRPGSVGFLLSVFGLVPTCMTSSSQKSYERVYS